jgi:glycosyl hydrolase family 9/cellulase-like Ig domain-containing protein
VENIRVKVSNQILVVAALLAFPAGAVARDRPAIRADQLGYAPAEHKVAYLIAPRVHRHARFAVSDANGHVVLRGHAGGNRGRWNRRFRAVQALDVSAVRTPGRYRLRAAGATTRFRVGTALFHPRVAEAVEFFRAQRDGADVIPGQLHRRPAHLNDRHASVYAAPRYDGPDSDVIRGRSLKRIGGPVDAEGGWMDAGDFIKFTHTTAYAAALLFVARRELGVAAPPTLEPEARFGLDWLDKAWLADGSLLLQVGIGSGNARGTFLGDHDLWRLPEKDDALKGRANRYLRHRPVFRANAPGTKLPPNLAGRVAAAFALAAQLDAAADPARARAELATGAAIYAAARTDHVKVVTALPHAFYPESSWHDDLELGGAELALAAQALADPRAAGWIADAMRWAEPGDDSLNLYDVSALAHAELVRALRASGATAGESELLADLRTQLAVAARRARHDPFRAAATYDDFDAAPHTFGLVAEAELYKRLTGDGRFDAFATAQRGWALGANAWGASLMIGVGAHYPRCPQHVVANLSGTRRRILVGAVVNGPNDRSLFAAGLGDFFDEGRTCPRGRDRYAAFTGRGSRYVDDVRAWQTVEPAIDFTAAAALAFALSP